jgi:hypothetical protein
MMIVWTGESVPADASMMTPPVIEGSAVKLTEATPFTVLAAAAESAPAKGGREVIAKFTGVPSETGLFRTFFTLAVIFVVWPFIRFELTTFRVIDAGSLVIKKLALTGDREPEVAWTVTAPDETPEEIVVEATPEVLVVMLIVVPVLKLAREAPDVIVKVTALLGTG